MKKSESERESEKMDAILAMFEWQKQVIEGLVGRVKHLESLCKALESELWAQRRGDGTGFKHQNDGGWFD